MALKTIIIAEAGINHNGDIALAKKLIDVAVDAGADYVKFQTFKTESVITKYAKAADYQRQNVGADNQYEMVKKLELSEQDFVDLQKYCGHRIKFLSTAFDLESLSFLNSLNMDFHKVASGEATNLPFLEAVAKTGKKIILSTGMCDLAEVKSALEVLQKNKMDLKNVTVLHCNTEYPSPYADVNLRAMTTIQKEFGVNVGYSDHTFGIEVSLAAVALGASVIEKHFTLDRQMVGPDHAASLEPEELKQMIKSIRHIEEAVAGNARKEPSKSEFKNRVVARRSIVAKNKITKGTILSAQNLEVKRPGDGISPMRWYDVLGQVANRDYEADEQIEGL